MTEFAYKSSLLYSLSQLLSPPSTSSNSIVKVIKPLHNVLKASTNHLVIYHLYYTEKPGMIEFANDSCLPLLSSKLLPLPDTPSDCTLKFTAYHPYYKKKFGMIKTVYNSYFYSKTNKLEITISFYQPKALCDFIHTTSIIKFLPDDITILDKQLQSQITNNFGGLRNNRAILQIVFTNSVIELYAMTFGPSIKKQH